MKTDSLFYRIFLEYPDLIFELAGLPLPAGTEYRQESVEIKQTSFRVDGVLRPTDPVFPLLFWESQLQPDDQFYARWFASIFLHLYQQPWSGWRGLAIYPDRKTERPPPATHAFVLEQGPIHRVYLSDLLEREAASWAQRLLRLIVAEEVRVPGEARELAERIGQRPAKLTEAQALDLLETLLIYKLPQLDIEGIRAMLNIPNTRLQDTVFYKEVFGIGRNEGRQEGRQEGQREGRQEGRVQGRRDEAVNLVMRQLKRRFGPAAGQCEQRLGELPLDRIEQLGEDLLDFKGVEELERWLNSAS